MDKEHSYLADSTFYLCFLEDIGKPEILLNMLSIFQFFIPTLVQKEVRVCKNYGKISGVSGIISIDFEPSLGELLRPFLSQRAIGKGEVEVIALAYHWSASEKIRKFILDDQEARKFVIDNLPHLAKSMIGTIGLIADCHCIFKLFTKVQALQILHDIKSSPFRVADNILSEVEAKIEGC